MKRMKKEESETSLAVKKNRTQLRHGSYSIALTAIVIVVVVVINLIVSQLPSQYTQPDFSGQKLSVLTDTTKDLVAGMDEDVTLYYLVQDSDKDEYVDRLLERYNDLSSHVTVVEKDPVLYPQFASQYTDETLSDNSVIAVCGDRSRVIPYDDMYEYEFSYTYYQYVTTGFDAEGQITSAIAALTSDGLPQLYTLTGHGEISLSDTLTQSIEKENIDVEELNLVTADTVPEDADCLLIASPTSDLSASEAEKVINYLRRGGSAVIITDYLGEDLPNLDMILEYYGTELVDGVIMEGDSNYYIQIPYYLVPNINSTDVSADMTDGAAYVLMAAAQGLESTDDAREDLIISSVLSTSSSSYSKTDVENMTTYEKEDGDIDGPFSIGRLVTEEVELTDELLEETASVDETADLAGWLDTLAPAEEETEDESEDLTEEESEDLTEAESEGLSEAESEDLTEEESEDIFEEESEEETESEPADTDETKLAVYTTSTLIDDSANTMISGGNFTLFVNTLSWACDQEASVSVPSKSVGYDSLTLTAASSNFWAIVTIVIIPGLILIIGLGIWLSRRKR